jgi:hypothetical protein
MIIIIIITATGAAQDQALQTIYYAKKYHKQKQQMQTLKTI